MKVVHVVLPLLALLTSQQVIAQAQPNSGQPTDRERQILDLTNQARAQARTCGKEQFGAAPPLTWNAQLGQAAEQYAARMAKQNFFAHQSPSGSTPWDRIKAAGYRDFKMAGENLAAGTRTPQETVQGWLNSPHHCANLMQPGFRELGVGYAENSDSKYHSYWVQEFGTKFAQ